MKVSDIISRVRNIAGDVDVLQFSDTSIIAWINDAMREIAADNQLLQKSATQTATVGQSKYPIPSDILKFHSVLYDGFDLRMIDFQTAKQEGYLNGNEGSPFVAWTWAGNLVLYPAPDEAKQLELIYTRTPVEVVGDAETPEVPAQYHNRLVDYCLAQVAQQDDDINRYNMKMAEFRTGVQAVKDLPEYEQNLYPYMNVSDRDGYDLSYD